MKIRIASTIVLAAAIALGASGCSLAAPQGTLTPYAPSDGVDVNVEGVDIRNVMLIADESGENFNVVFGAVNRTGKSRDLAMSFVADGAQSARAEFTLPAGSSLFGNPDGPETPVLVTIPELKAGATVTAYFQTAGSPEVRYEIPVLDGTLAEYTDYVLPANFAKQAEKEAAKKRAKEDSAASQSKIGDDVAEVPAE